MATAVYAPALYRYGVSQKFLKENGNVECQKVLAPRWSHLVC